MNANAPLMAGKRGLIMGVANDRSIAWGMAGRIRRMAAELALSYQGDALEGASPARRLNRQRFPVAVRRGDKADVAAVIVDLRTRWARLDFLVHAIAYSDKEQLKGRYVDTSRANFLMAARSALFVHRRLPARGAADAGGGSC